VKSDFGAITERREPLLRDGVRYLRAHSGAAVALLLAAIAVADIAALPSAHGSASISAATAAGAPTYLGVLAGPAQAASAASAAAEEDPAARRFTGIVGTNLSDALLRAGVPQRQGTEYIALLAKAIRLADGLSVADRFDLVIERREDGSLAQLLYAGLDRVARADVELMKWTDGKHTIWVNADGVGGEQQGGMERPVPGRVTSPFGKRFHPILGYERMHKGVDLAAAYGSPIVAAADGRVVSAGWHGGYGNQVAIAHGGGMQTTYGHMSRIAAFAGEAVRRGQVIGYVGSTGLSTGPHVHFEVTKDGRPVNPLSARLASGPATLQGEKLVRFHSELRQMLLLPGA
jgi:murein DD-endopeptidase MepM/ murein hydrolase activator NlpD